MHFYWKVHEGHAVFLLFQIRNTAPILYPIRTPSHPSLSTIHCIQTMVRPTLVPEESIFQGYILLKPRNIHCVIDLNPYLRVSLA